MFSLCIATIDRFDEFLSKYIPKYLEMDLIDEIVISDENGNDVAKIRDTFPNHPKLRLFVNENRLGPLLNKLKACYFAKNEWIALIDSDNFAGYDYFETAKNYMISNDLFNKKNIIISPSFARPNFNYKMFEGIIYTCNDITNEATKRPGSIETCTLMNTGNYIINKYLTNNLDLSNEQNIHMSSSCDVIYLNTLLFEQLDLNFHVVPNMEYDHLCHMGSIYIQTHQYCREFGEQVHKRYKNLEINN